MNSLPHTHDADITIVGAGLAGLSMAVRLARPEFSALRIRVLDPRPSLTGNKTWCAWRLHAHPFASCVSARWMHGLVSDARRGAIAASTLDFSACPYERITEADLIEYAQSILASAPHVSLHLGENVVRIERDTPSRAQGEVPSTVHTATGHCKSRLVLDSRPTPFNPHAWQQIFFGGEYQLASNQPRATQNTFTMMALREVPRGGGCAFVYELPISNDRSLIQATAFVPPGAPQTFDWQQMIADYATTHGLALQALSRPEHGVIAMDADVTPTSALTSVTNIGARGGFVRASTGYSFSRTQRACDALVIAIKQWSENARQLPIPIDWQSSMVPILDRTFLRALARDDVDSADLFWQLSRAANGATLARFLDGEPTARDLATVIAAMPTFPFLAAGLQASLTKRALQA